MAHLLEAYSLVTVVKALCMGSNMIVQLSPLSEVKRWESSGSTGDADAAPYVAIAFGGCQWCFYGLFAWYTTGRSGFLILFHSNCLGAMLGAYYASVFYRTCSKKASLDNMNKYLGAVMSLVFFQVCSLCTLSTERACFLTGVVASFCSFAGALSMLVTVPLVVRSRDSASIPGPFVVATMVSAAVWFLCGWILDDPMVMVPNMFSIWCAGVTLYLKFLYPSIAKDDKSMDNAFASNVKRSSSVYAERTGLILPNHVWTGSCDLKND